MDMANFITVIRILFSVGLLFTRTFSPTFYVFYIIAGISDVLDGIVARKFNLVSSLGEKLDDLRLGVYFYFFAARGCGVYLVASGDHFECYVFFHCCYLFV